jgi:hypothetical protein
MFRKNGRSRLLPAVLLAAGLATAAATSPALAAGGATGTEHIVMMNSTTSGVYSVIATGVFTAGGTINLPSGSNELKLTGGTLKIIPKFGPSKMSFNSKTCLVTVTGSVTYKLGHGTGAYAKVTGSGHATLSQRQVNARNAHGKCSTTKAIVSQGLVTASGPAAVG